MTDSHHPLVLVVDDDADTRELYRMVLESVGYRVEDAAYVRDALAAAARAVPDLVMTDWLLPDGDGLDVCRELRGWRPTRRVPFIAVTGLSLDEAGKDRAREKGVDAILRKPVNPDDVLAAIRTALTIASERRLCNAATRARRYTEHVGRRRAASGCTAGLDAGALLQRAASRSDGSIALLIADDSAHYVAASGATRDLTGYEAVELAGLSVWDLTPPSNAAAGQALWKQFIAAGTAQGRYVLRRRDGTAIEAQYCAVANIAPGWHVSALTELPDLPVTLQVS